MNLDDVYKALADWSAAKAILNDARAKEDRQRKLLETAAGETAAAETQVQRLEQRARAAMDGKAIAPVAIAGVA